MRRLRSRPRPVVVLVLVALVAGITVALLSGDTTETTTAAPQAPLVPRDSTGHIAFGYNENVIAAGIATPAEAVMLHRRSGSRVARLPIQWGHVETLPGERDWSGYVERYQAYVDAGIEVLWTAMVSPSWAVADTSLCKNTSDCRVGPSAEHRADFARFVRDIAQRFPDSVGIEIWNEPNQHSFWRYPDPAAYAALVKASFAETRTVSQMPILAGGVSNNQSTTRDANGRVLNYSLTEFLDAMYANGAKGSFDALSYHAYQVYPGDPLIGRAIDQVDAVLAKHGDSERRRWMTEIGGSTTGNGSGNTRTFYTEAQQRDILLFVYQHLNGRTDHDAMLVHTLVEYDASNTGKEGYGLVKPKDANGVFTPKPAYCAFATELAVGGTCGPMSAGG